MMADIIDDNYSGTKQSFLDLLHEESTFDMKAFMDLCNYIRALDSITINELQKLHFIHYQILRHLIYHFDINDQYEISDLPQNYWDYIELIEATLCRLKPLP